MATTTRKPACPQGTNTPTTAEEWGALLATTEVGTPEQAEAMRGMRGAGASYALIAEAMGVVPVTAPGRYLKVAATLE
jgi:hypothetical protein